MIRKEAAALMANVISCEFRDIDHFREQLRGWDTPAIQIERGPLNICLHQVDFGGLIFFDVRVNRKVIDYSRIESGWFSFVVNLSPVMFCGIEIIPGQMTVLAPGREYQSALAKSWHSIEIVISSSVLAEEGLRLAPHLVSGPENATISLPVELTGIFRRLAKAAFGRNGSGRVDYVWLRRALLRALDKALRIGESGRHDLDERRKIEGYELTRKMIRYIESRFGQRVTVNEIACELNVTPRALHYAARSTLGISSQELILIFRLNHVRGELWEGRFSEPSITTAALTQDFGHFGRFSQQYRTLFSESPSQTLQRVRQLGD